MQLLHRWKMNSNLLAMLGAAAISAAGAIAAYEIKFATPPAKIERVETREVTPCPQEPSLKKVAKGDGETRVMLDNSINW